jgi:hypothetical protein
MYTKCVYYYPHKAVCPGIRSSTIENFVVLTTSILQPNIWQFSTTQHNNIDIFANLITYGVYHEYYNQFNYANIMIARSEDRCATRKVHTQY